MMIKKSPSPESIEFLRKTASISLENCLQEVDSLKECLNLLQTYLKDPFTSKEQYAEFVSNASLITQEIGRLVGSAGICILATTTEQKTTPTKLH